MTLGGAELARLAACDRETIERYVELGLLRPDADSAAFDPGDVTRAKLLAGLEQAGTDLESLAAAVREGRLSLGFAGQVIADQPGVTERSQGQALAELGFDAAFANRLRLALGLPAVRPTDPVREDDLELYGIMAGARREGLPEDSLLRAMRAFGLSVRQIVEVQRELFRGAVEQPMLESGLGHREMFEAGADKRLQLQRLGYRTIYLLLRRFLEQVVFENLVERLEESLDEHDIRRSVAERERAIVFVDLTGYTRLTEEAGDIRAAEHGARLVEIALGVCAESEGRFVKALGDGVLLQWNAAAPAVRGALEIVRRVGESGPPDARAGVSWGPVVQREGDVFGRTVNLAARLVDVAHPGTVVTTESVGEEARTGELVFERHGAHALQGIAAPVPVLLARLEAP